MGYIYIIQFVFGSFVRGLPHLVDRSPKPPFPPISFDTCGAALQYNAQ